MQQSTIVYVPWHERGQRGVQAYRAGRLSPGAPQSTLDSVPRYLRVAPVLPSAVIIVRVVGSRDMVLSAPMCEVVENPYLGVQAGDVLTVSCGGEPKVGNLVLVVRGDARMLCRLTEHEGVRYFVWGQRMREREELRSGSQVWGVVSSLSRSL